MPGGGGRMIIYYQLELVIYEGKIFQIKIKNQLKEGGSDATFFATNPFPTDPFPTDPFLTDPTPTDPSLPDPSLPDLSRPISA
jgi:hypothetical protein